MIFQSLIATTKYYISHYQSFADQVETLFFSPNSLAVPLQK